MAAVRGLATPVLEINDQVIQYLPNTITWKGGAGDINVRHQSAGGGAGSTVITEDAESRVSMLKFSVANTAENNDLIEDWLQASRNLNGVSARLSDSGFTRAFRGMRITSDPERNIGTEGAIELEFMGDPSA